MWATLAEAVIDVRTLTSDGPTDKLADHKRCLGVANGINVNFKTFDKRRLTDLTVSGTSFCEAIYINGVATLASVDDPISGNFILATAPVGGDLIEATYYYRWFLDSEIEMFLKNAVQWLGLGTDPLVVPDGLQPACIHYAAQEAYHKLALYWSQKLSEQYMMEDAPDEKRNSGPVGMYTKLAKDFHEKAVDLRDNYYKRQGQTLAPLFSSIPGRVRAVTPQR